MLPIIKKETMIFEMEAKDKAEAIEKMIELFDQNGYLIDKECFRNDIFEREKIFSTFIGYGIGLPHGKSDGVKKAGISVAKLKHEIIWNEETGDKADMILMLAVRNHVDNNFHLKILSKLSRLLMHEDFRDELKSGNRDQVFSILVKNLEV